MAVIKLTKNELRAQEMRLAQLEKYLPTLQLKKTLLQVEVYNARSEVKEAELRTQRAQQNVESFTALMTEVLPISLEESAAVIQVSKRYENIAGVEIPSFVGIEFQPLKYALFDLPPWVDAAIGHLRERASALAVEDIAREKALALEYELREVSIRVNLFEKILIPDAELNIKRIKVFLGDQQLAAVAQAKVAKAKIAERQARRVRV